jgi:hypothetical protein
VQQVIEAQADAKKKAIAEQTRTPSEQDKKDALVKAGKMADAGIKAGLVVVGAEAAVAVAVVGGPAAAAGGRVVGAAAETYVPGGVATLNQIPDAIRGWRAAGTTPGTIPQTPGGLVGAGARAVYEIIKALWQKKIRPCLGIQDRVQYAVRSSAHRTLVFMEIVSRVRAAENG